MQDKTGRGWKLKHLEGSEKTKCIKRLEQLPTHQPTKEMQTAEETVFIKSCTERDCEAADKEKLHCTAEKDTSKPD